MRLRLFPQTFFAGVFVVAALIAFSTNLNSYFLSDDFAQIGKVLHGDYSFTWGQAHGGFFRPLFILSYIIDSKIWHYRPFGYHLTNILVHGLNSFLLFKLGLRLLAGTTLPSRSVRAASAAAAALFLIHPSHTEAVTWISGRADLLATCFILISLWRYCDYVEKPQALNLVLTIIPAVAALLSKESAICLPFLIVALGVYLERGRRVLIEFGVFLLLLLAFVLARAMSLGSLVGGYGERQHLNFSPGWIRDRLLEGSIRSTLPTLPDSWSSFLFKPLQSPLFYVIAAVSIGLLVLAFVIRARRYGISEKKTQNRFIVLLAILFLISLLPVINLRLSVHQSQGERFLYLPTVFMCVLISYALMILVRNPRIWLAIVIVVLGFYSWRLYVANQLWRQAARLTQSVTNDLVILAATDQLTIINAPDNLRGVPVFHNGLLEALQLFPRAKRFEQVEINSFQSLQTSADVNEIRKTGEELVIQPADTRDTFDRASSAGCLELVSSSPLTLQLRSQPCVNGRNILFFSDGQLRTALP